MAADEKAAISSGADIGEGLRRRQIPLATVPGQGQPAIVDDKKNQTPRQVQLLFRYDRIV